MNINNITETNKIHLLDSLNTSLLKLKVKIQENTVIPNTNVLILYVDKSNNISKNTQKKVYEFDIKEPLNINDELNLELKVENNDIKMNTSILKNNKIEEIENKIITLFEGENIIYTNYENALIEITYLTNNEFNKTYLNNSIYYNHKLNTNEFNLEDIYFKDAFNKTKNNLNLEIDNLNIDSLTSKNNKFNLDSDGNLTVNSITTLEVNSENILDNVYPIGSIYMSVNSTNPSLLFGGTWEQIKDRFLLSAGDNYKAGDIGGEASHLLTASESGLRSHNHLVGRDNDAGYNGNNGSIHANGNYSDSTNGANWKLYTSSVSDQNAKVSHNNMPPYLTVYMFKRID